MDNYMVILLVAAILVAAIIIAMKQRRAGGNQAPQQTTPSLGLLNTNGPSVGPIDGNKAIENGYRLTSVSTPAYHYQRIEPETPTQVVYEEGKNEKSGSKESNYYKKAKMGWG